MNYKNKFEDGQKVKLVATNEEVTVNHWSYIPKMERYSYTIIEHPSTFYFEDELTTLEAEE